MVFYCNGSPCRKGYKGAISVGGLLIVALPLLTSLSKAIQYLRKVLGAVAQGDLTVHPDTSKRDELGDMDQAGVVSTENSASIRLVAQITGEVDSIAHEMQSLIGRFRLS